MKNMLHYESNEYLFDNINNSILVYKFGQTCYGVS
jgi:hypothetical protein